MVVPRGVGQRGAGCRMLWLELVRGFVALGGTLHATCRMLWLELVQHVPRAWDSVAVDATCYMPHAVVGTGSAPASRSAARYMPHAMVVAGELVHGARVARAKSQT